MAENTKPNDAIRRVTTTKDGAIGSIVIENPARLNAMSLSMWHDLRVCVKELEADPAVRVIMVMGAGEKAFCAGGDISEFEQVRNAENAATVYDAAGKSALEALKGAAKPTIALIHGYCLGGGLGLALQCDLRLAADNAKFGIPAAKRGIAYSFAGIRQLIDLAGPSHTLHVLYSGRQFSAAEALAMGLVTQVHAQAGLVEAGQELAASIAANAPLSLRAAKVMVTMATRDPADRDMASCEAAEAACLASDDYAEATRAFVEKRPPVFTGR